MPTGTVIFELFLGLDHFEDPDGIVIVPHGEYNGLIDEFDESLEEGLHDEGKLHAPQGLPGELKERASSHEFLRGSVLGHEPLLFQGLKYPKGRAFDYGKPPGDLAHAEGFLGPRNQP